MILYNFVFYTSLGVFTAINVIALKEFYWDSIRPHVTQLQDIHRMVNSWKIVAMLYCSMTVIFFKQWLNKTATHMPDGRYVLTHILNGKLVKIVVRPTTKLPSSVVDEDYEECYVDEAIPFLRYEQEPFSNETIGAPKKLLLHY